jgi:hypothetical protein
MKRSSSSEHGPGVRRYKRERAVSDTGETRNVPPDAEMPSGEMREPTVHAQRDAMPSGEMREPAVYAQRDAMPSGEMREPAVHAQRDGIIEPRSSRHDVE